MFWPFLTLRKRLAATALTLAVLLTAACEVCPCSAGDLLPPLAEAEQMVGDGPEVLAALSAMERDEKLAELEHQRKGVKYFAGVGFGYSDEPIYETSDESNSYSKLSAQIGLSFPLFGTWNKEKISEIESRIKAVESKYRPALLKLNNLTALRKAYITLWSECGKTAMARSFLSTERTVSRVLFERQQKGLVLPADRLEAMTAYDMARRDIAVSRLNKVRAMHIIRLATGRMWDMPEKMDIPTLPEFSKLTPRLDDRPELKMSREVLRLYDELVRASRYPGREGTFNIGASVGKDFPGSTGTGVFATANITEPLKTLFSHEDKAHTAAEKERERAEREELYTRISVAGKSEETLAYAGYASANIAAQESRLASMAENVREKLLRHASIAGDTFERLQASRYQYYRVAADMLDSEMIFMQTGADLLSCAYPEGAASEPASRIRPIEDTQARKRLLNPDWMTATTGPDSVYVWNAAPLLDIETRRSQLARLRAEGFTHVLLSFNAEQINAMASPESAESMEKLLETARGDGIRVDLLLGEPTWLYPANRGKLLNIISAMSAFKFGGIHLDIEPDSLSENGKSAAQLLDMLIETVAGVRKQTKLPLSISIHPRFLEGELAAQAEKGLGSLGLEYAAVMIYSNNVALTERRFSKISENCRALNLKLAQSVESGIPGDETFHASGRAGYAAAMESLIRRLGAVRGFKGIIIQSWEEYQSGGMSR